MQKLFKFLITNRKDFSFCVPSKCRECWERDVKIDLCQEVSLCWCSSSLWRSHYLFIWMISSLWFLIFSFLAVLLKLCSFLRALHKLIKVFWTTGIDLKEVWVICGKYICWQCAVQIFKTYIYWRALLNTF